MECFEAHSFPESKMGEIASLVFLIVPWFSQSFLYVLNENFSLLGPLQLLYHSFIQGWVVPLLAPPLKEKDTMKGIIYEIAKVDVPIYLATDRSQQFL